MIQPQVIVLFCITFIALGIFNVLTGRRRMQQGYVQERQLPWYKQLRILTGIEYVLIGLAFFMNISISYHWLPTSLNSIILPFYLVVLFASGILAGVVIYQGINMRRRRTPSTSEVRTPEITRATTAQLKTPEERATHAQKLRERRQKAAAARRRRAGKA